jgi:hypothetical protein
MLPGTYSKRTVNFLSSLDKEDAVLFTELCTFVWVVGHVIPLVHDVKDPVYARHGITFDSLIHLDSIGLIRFDGFTRLVEGEFPKRLSTNYYGQRVDLEFQNESGNRLEIGHALLTRIGGQLAPICGSKPDQAFFDYVVNCWKQRGYIKGEAQQPEAGEPA